MKIARTLAVAFAILALVHNVLAEEHQDRPSGTNAIAPLPAQSNSCEAASQGARRPHPRTIPPSQRELRNQLEEVNNMLIEYEGPPECVGAPTNAAYAAKRLNERKELKERSIQLVWESPSFFPSQQLLPISHGG